MDGERLGERVEPAPEGRADLFLKADDLRGRDVHVPVDVRLERPGVRHDSPGETKEAVDPSPKNRLSGRRLPKNVRVPHQDLRAESVREVLRRPDRAARVDDGQEPRGRYGSVRGLHPTAPRESVAL